MRNVAARLHTSCGSAMETEKLQSWMLRTLMVKLVKHKKQVIEVMIPNQKLHCLVITFQTFPTTPTRFRIPSTSWNLAFQQNTDEICLLFCVCGSAACSLLLVCRMSVDAHGVVDVVLVVLIGTLVVDCWLVAVVCWLLVFGSWFLLVCLLFLVCCLLFVAHLANQKALR